MLTKTLFISSHSRDCTYYCYSEGGNEKWEYNGYTVGGLCVGSEGSDDINIEIDIDTGQIIGWDSEQVKAKLAELIAKQNWE